MVSVVLVSTLLLLNAEAKTVDPYKVKSRFFPIIIAYLDEFFWSASIERKDFDLVRFCSEVSYF